MATVLLLLLACAPSGSGPASGDEARAPIPANGTVPEGGYFGGGVGLSVNGAGNARLDWACAYGDIDQATVTEGEIHWAFRSTSLVDFDKGDATLDGTAGGDTIAGALAVNGFEVADIVLTAGPEPDTGSLICD